jgi:hypothetical protein
LADAKSFGDDVDHDHIPNYLDTDSDGDGVPDSQEPGDKNGDGRPDYLTTGGASGGALCSVHAGRAAHGADVLGLLAACGALLLWRRRRRAQPR